MVLNAAARLVVGADTYQHITPVPRDVLYLFIYLFNLSDHSM